MQETEEELLMSKFVPRIYVYNTWGSEKCAQNFGRKPQKKGELKDPSVDGRIIIKRVL
jgi:hypothetical protein